MHRLIPAAALLLAGWSVIGRSGLCRFDQIFATIDAAGGGPDSLATLVNQDPANPLVWCAYAESLSLRGEMHKAGDAFDRAVSLGPGMPPVLMRAANFEFTHERPDRGFLLAARILERTSAFDEILFSYLQRSGVPCADVFGTAIPAAPRPARAWFAWLRTHGSLQDLRDTWRWMKLNGLLDGQSAGEVAWTLWNRKSYAAAKALWTDWAGQSTNGQLLVNPLFENAPNESPFDWTLGSSPAVSLARSNGLEIRFAGTENIAFSQVHQFTVLPPGRYRFSAEIQSHALTTDQGLYFHIFDLVDPRRLDVRTHSILGTAMRSWVSIDFTVPRGTDALAVQLERRPSDLFDNRIAGRLHVYRVSLEKSQSLPGPRAASAGPND